MTDAADTKTTQGGPVRVKSAKAWGERGLHDITLPSATIVKVRIPDIPQLIKEDKLPNHLLETAIKVAQGSQEVSTEHIKEQPEFYHNLVALTVVEPPLTPEEVAAHVPYEDQELLVEIATRQRDIDAEGRHIGGLDKSERWRKFRGIDYGDEDVADVSSGG